MMFFTRGLFFCTGGKESDVGEVIGTQEGTAACSPPQCDPHPWPTQLPEQKLSFPQYEIKSPGLRGPIQVL